MKRRLLILVAALAIASPAVAQVTIVPAPYINGGGVVRGPLLGPLGTDCTAATITYSFNGDTDTGWQRTAANQMDACANGAAVVRITASGLQVNASAIGLDSFGSSNYSISYNGWNFGAAGENSWLGRSRESSPADGVWQFLNNARTGFNRLILGTNDSSGLSLSKNGTQLEVRDGSAGNYTSLVANNIDAKGYLAAGSGSVATAGSGDVRIPNTHWIVSRNTTNDGDVNIARANASNQIELGANTVVVANSSFGFAAPAFVRTAPTVASGFGSSSSVVANNGTAVFTVNVGTGGTASSGVITMPPATTGYACHAKNLTALAAGRASQSTTAGTTWQTATTTTSVTVTNLNLATGGAVAWAASDVLQLECTGY